ncbi:uncharacterized protein UHOD_12398 [Ustilago sp. UG-2017b]|nr:uncharacterized protein UHOD_12398 [Ustilago sp. UG-2017b]
MVTLHCDSLSNGLLALRRIAFKIRNDHRSVPKKAGQSSVPPLLVRPPWYGNGSMSLPSLTQPERLRYRSELMTSLLVLRTEHGTAHWSPSPTPNKLTRLHPILVFDYKANILSL